MNKRNAPFPGQRRKDCKNSLYYLSPFPRCQQRIPIYAGNGRVVGEVKNGVFSKKVKASKHFLKKPPAICFDISSLKEAEAAGATHIEIEDTETGKTYHAPLRLVWQKGFTLDRGYGRQIGLLLNLWETGEADENQLTLFKVE